MPLVWCQRRCVSVTLPVPPALTASAAPPYPDSTTTTPSCEQTGEVYTSLPRPSHDHSSLPVFGSKPLTFSGTPSTNSSWPSTRMTSGVLHEPSHSVFFVPNMPPGSSCCQTFLPVLLSTARRNCRSPG